MEQFNASDSYRLMRDSLSSYRFVPIPGIRLELVISKL